MTTQELKKEHIYTKLNIKYLGKYKTYRMPKYLETYIYRAVGIENIPESIDNKILIKYIEENCLDNLNILDNFNNSINGILIPKLLNSEFKLGYNKGFNR